MDCSSFRRIKCLYIPNSPYLSSGIQNSLPLSSFSSIVLRYCWTCSHSAFALHICGWTSTNQQSIVNQSTLLVVCAHSSRWFFIMSRTYTFVYPALVQFEQSFFFCIRSLIEISFPGTIYHLLSVEVKLVVLALASIWSKMIGLASVFPYITCVKWQSNEESEGPGWFNELGRWI